MIKEATNFLRKNAPSLDFSCRWPSDISLPAYDKMTVELQVTLTALAVLAICLGKYSIQSRAAPALNVEKESKTFRKHADPNEEHPSLTDLDILTKIFGEHLRPEDLANTAHVCQSWNTLSNSREVWADQYQTKFGQRKSIPRNISPPEFYLCAAAFEKALSDRNPKEVKYLDFSDSILPIPTQVFELSQLEVLILSGKQLRKLPLQIGELTQLTDLSLHKNYIKNLPKEITKLTLLQKLRLDNNRIKNFPEAITKLTQLRALNLSQNKITKVSASTLRPLLRRGCCINLSNNPLTEETKDELELLKIQYPQKLFF